MSKSNEKKIKSDRDELVFKDDKPTLDLIIKNSFFKRKCFEEGYLPEIGWEDDSLEYFNLKGLNKVRFKMLSVITGENGTGKSSLLKLLRQKIVKVYNNPLPKYVVRYLSNGEISDNYDPEEHKHPLLNVKTIEKKCKNLIDYQCNALKEDLNLKQKREIEKIIARCEDKFGKSIFEENCEKWGNDQKNDESEYFFEEIKKIYKRLILKRLSFGCLKQLINLDLTYEHEINKINSYIQYRNEFGIEFPYKIVTKKYEMTNKAAIEDKFYLYDDAKNIKLKLSDLSPGERLILHMLLIARDPESISLIEDTTKQVFLLDEMDSHSHPNLVKTMVNIINHVLIDKIGMQVIMTTHNPTTIALFDRNCIYKLYKCEELDEVRLEGIYSLQDKFRLMQLLSDLYICHNQEYAKTFFLKEDYCKLFKTFYSALGYKKYINFEKIDKDLQNEFSGQKISNLSFIKFEEEKFNSDSIKNYMYAPINVYYAILSLKNKLEHSKNLPDYNKYKKYFDTVINEINENYFKNFKGISLDNDFEGLIKKKKEYEKNMNEITKLTSSWVLDDKEKVDEDEYEEKKFYFSTDDFITLSYNKNFKYADKAKEKLKLALNSINDILENVLMDEILLIPEEFKLYLDELVNGFYGKDCGSDSFKEGYVFPEKLKDNFEYFIKNFENFKEQNKIICISSKDEFKIDLNTIDLSDNRLPTDCLIVDLRKKDLANSSINCTQQSSKKLIFVECRQENYGNYVPLEKMVFDSGCTTTTIYNQNLKFLEDKHKYSIIKGHGVSGSIDCLRVSNINIEMQCSTDEESEKTRKKIEIDIPFNFRVITSLLRQKYTTFKKFNQLFSKNPTIPFLSLIRNNKNKLFDKDNELNIKTVEKIYKELGLTEQIISYDGLLGMNYLRLFTVEFNNQLFVLQNGENNELYRKTL